MATNIEVKCNFTSLFAKYNTVEEIKFLANLICGQVKTAYDARVKEIASGKTGVEVTVEVSEKSDAPKAKTKKDSTAGKAKEVAAKMKELKLENTSDNDSLIAITDTQAIKKLGLTFEKYNDRCWVLRGDTKPLRVVLKEKFKGVYNSRLTGGAGWVIKTANAQECANALGIKAKVA